RTIGVELIDDRAVNGHRGDPGVGLLEVGQGEHPAVEGEAHLGTGLVGELGAATGVAGVDEARPGAAEGDRAGGVLVGPGSGGRRWRRWWRWLGGDGERVEQQVGAG